MGDYGVFPGDPETISWNPGKDGRSSLMVKDDLGESVTVAVFDGSHPPEGRQEFTAAMKSAKARSTNPPVGKKTFSATVILVKKTMQGSSEYNLAVYTNGNLEEYCCPPWA
jgi:hypothetical protein